MLEAPALCVPVVQVDKPFVDFLRRVGKIVEEDCFILAPCTRDTIEVEEKPYRADPDGREKHG
mgnify:CR=1 FL=1